MFVMVANIIAFASFVGPTQDASSRGKPEPNSRLMASPATTGISTNKPRAMISVAIDTC